MRRFSLFAIVISFVVGCQRSDEDKKKTSATGSAGLSVPRTGSGSAATPERPKAEQITPPLDIKNPPADAVKTPSGLTYKKLVVNEAGTSATRNDTVLINYTGWRQSTGETFFTNKGRGQPMPLNLATTAAGFTEAMQLVKKGEKAMLWVPPEIGYKGPPQGAPETLVYEVEVVDIVPAPPIPGDYKAPPPTAQALPSGAKYVVVRPGTGKEKARSFDTVTFHYTAWDQEGRMFDSTEMRKRPATVPPYRQSAVMEDVLTTMTAGQRIRFWVDAEKMTAGGKPQPGIPTGLLCYELEILQIAKAVATPPPVPGDVGKPPGETKKTAGGVAYKILKTGKGGPKPAKTDVVRVHYTGWTTDGRMFDSSVVKGEPAEFALDKVIPGWTEGIPVMSIGDRVRFWIPEELAYKGQPGRPQGMLVFDVELLEIKPPAPADAHGADDGHGHGKPPAAKADIPAPSDVAKPPANAKKSPKGVAYKVLQAGKGGPKPKPTDTVKVHYTGWTTDGKMFDSSVTRGEPIEFPLTGVIPGWTDAIPVMSVGDKTRFWIPEELAYKGQQGAPQGMLVFDVELIEIKPGH
ncbi:MAG: FKBP-type peptidyl-prolyl cis-trans isomerase [Deltaproteobacteria bacterium]|nr:FKBP-type peptidyl-prolyl cis-trans isomerase [Deltaproteobacteria bacterium]MDQ3300786.1 FKBP-type peptidyl-prolyl cis-trans isomerase [Myxococcota bacterium]